ncbi:MAG: DUF481 domain-containing protein [Kiritimatiellaeota bacterium]|nr:DUF481 domain-containing protein [Kiritimatiellota bacterium]
MANPRPLLLALAAPLALTADTVRLDNGDLLTGKVTQIAKGVVSLETAYAGVVSIAQTNVAALVVDTPANIRAADDRVAGGNLDVASLRALWPVGAPDPDAKPPVKNPWSFSIAAEARHIDGNSRGTVVGLNAEANYTLPEKYTAKFYAGANYNRTDGDVSEHKVFGGVDADYFLSDHSGLYGRDELLADRANDIRYRNTLGAGGEYFLHKKAIPGGLEMLRLRAGLGHRREKHRTADDDSVSAMTLDFGLRFHKRLSDVLAWTTEITYAPAIDNINNYLFTHDSRCGIDLVKKWRLTYELGVQHAYNSRPADDNVYLDSTYYTRIKKTW